MSNIFIFPPLNPTTTNFINNDHPVYNKSNWGALNVPLKSPLQPLPISLIIISHTATKNCVNFDECARIIQEIQYNFLENKCGDIGYNFLIGGDGGIYTGRGWDTENTIRRNSIVIAFIGDFNKKFANNVSEDGAIVLIEEGVNQGFVKNDYKLLGENQTSPMRFYSPGWNLVGVIRKWSHYFDGTVF